MGGGCDRGKAKGGFVRGKGGGHEGKRLQESGGAGGVLARAGFGHFLAEGPLEGGPGLGVVIRLRRLAVIETRERME